MTHSASRMQLSPSDRGQCAACPDAWFWVGFDTEYSGGIQGVYVILDDGSFRYLALPLEDVLASGYPVSRVFEVGRDGYYLTLAQARAAIDIDEVHGIHYVDDFNDEYQDYYICADDDTHTPFAEAHYAEPIR